MRIDESMETEQFIIVTMKLLVGDIIACEISHHDYFSDTCKMRLSTAAQTLSTYSDTHFPWLFSFLACG